jgi:hypothetical protein
LDLPEVTQAPTLDQLAANIREAIALRQEGEDLAELCFANDPAVIATMELARPPDVQAEELIGRRSSRDFLPFRIWTLFAAR